MAKEMRRRYKDPDYMEQRRAVKLGLSTKEPKFDEVEVVTMKGSDGKPIRVTADQVESYEAVLAEMASSKKGSRK